MPLLDSGNLQLNARRPHRAAQLSASAAPAGHETTTTGEVWEYRRVHTTQAQRHTRGYNSREGESDPQQESNARINRRAQTAAIDKFSMRSPLIARPVE